MKSVVVPATKLHQDIRATRRAIFLSIDGLAAATSLSRERLSDLEAVRAFPQATEIVLIAPALIEVDSALQDLRWRFLRKRPRKSVPSEDIIKAIDNVFLQAHTEIVLADLDAAIARGKELS